MARHDDDEDLDDRDETPEEEESEPAVKPKITVTATVLIILNFLTTLGFLVLLFMNYQARQEWSYAVFRNHLAVWGLPLEEEEKYPGYHASRPRLRLTAEQTKESFGKRGGKMPAKVTEFASVEEPIAFRILPSQTEAHKAEIFQGVGPPVATLEEEVRRLKASVPSDIEQAAATAAEPLKTEAQKRQALENVLVPLAWNEYQVKELDKKVKDAKAAELDGLLKDALQRRMIVDLLGPLNVFRPGDGEKYTVEKASELATNTLEHLKELLAKRFDAAIAAKYDAETHFGKLWVESRAGGEDAEKRDSIEKRQHIGFLLFALAQVQVPVSGQPLYPEGLARAQTVLGLHETALATQNYTRSVRVLEDRVLDALNADRQGYVVETKTGTASTNGFVERHDMEVERSKKLVVAIRQARLRLDDLKGQHKRLEKVHEERTEHLKTVLAKLTKARAGTAKQVEELRLLQRQLFEAQSELADAAERNFRLEAAIRAAEKRLTGGK